MHTPDRPTRRRLLKAALASGVIALAPLNASAAPGVIVRTRSGSVRGMVADGIHVFRGLRYGADTSTERFQRARAEVPWLGVRDATQPVRPAPQTGALGPGTEDCLALNIATPALRDGRRRPVLVYIHGGGYTQGWASDPLYDSVRLCRRGDVVVASVQHRLGVFGYLSLGGYGDARFRDSGNVGQLDLIDALKWIREHAAEFGGDPDNITLFGQSGGGAKIATLMAMPEASGLFQKAWTMSGQQVTAAGPRAARQRSDLLLDALGVPHAQLDRLLSLPADALLKAAQIADPSRIEDTRLYFGPVLDGHALPRHPFHPDAPSQSAAIPMVIGNTLDETRAFLGADDAMFALTWDTLPAQLERQQYSDVPVEMVIDAYRRMHPDWSPSQVFFRATTAGRSWRGAIIEAEARARQGAPTWAYELDWPSPLDGGRWGAMHTLDIPLVFGTLDAMGSKTGTGAEARAVSNDMSDALIAFARTGSPQHARLPAWPHYSLARRETLVFDAAPRLANDPRGDERRLWDSVPFIQRGTF
ncbi:carboxylesterase/lipase family protein [Lysobacter sp. HA18]